MSDGFPVTGLGAGFAEGIKSFREAIAEGQKSKKESDKSKQELTKQARGLTKEHIKNSIDNLLNARKLITQKKYAEAKALTDMTRAGLTRISGIDPRTQQSIDEAAGKITDLLGGVQGGKLSTVDALGHVDKMLSFFQGLQIRMSEKLWEEAGFPSFIMKQPAKQPEMQQPDAPILPFSQPSESELLRGMSEIK